jgi:peptidoglycan/xylan/chitin deacetylase (PgdA/CDA1 family)
MLVSVKDRLVATLAAPGIRRIVATSARSSLVIIMMHRFHGRGGYNGHSPQVLRRILHQLRSSGVALVDVETALQEFGDESSSASSGRMRPPRVAFTIDDGYADAVEIAGPIFSEFECPVTCFVVPNVVDGKTWYWWDMVETLLFQTSNHEITLEHHGELHVLPTRSEADRRAASHAICDWIKRIPAEAVQTLIGALALAAEVDLPMIAPPQYRVLSWAEMRAAESKGWRFGAHTMTHPVIDKCTDARAEWEIGESLVAVRAELANPTGVFCYPVGRVGDFGERDIALMKKHGVQWALSAIPGRLRPHSSFVNDPSWRWRIPRFTHDERAGGIMRMLLAR